MRYVTVELLQDGMILAQTLFNPNFSTLLSEGTTLEQHHISRINELGYGGVYIEDALSAGISSHDVVSVATRLKTISAAKELKRQVEGGAFESDRKMTRVSQESIIMPLIEEIIANPKRMIDRVDTRPYEDYDHYHSANVVILSLLIGVELGLSGMRLYEVGQSSLLADIGNVFIPKALLDRPGRLTAEEHDVVKRHTQMGFEYLREHFDISIEGCMGALHHHENYDGSGYPNGLRRDRISIYGRIIAITDVFDALISRRPYRKPMFPSTAMEFIEMNSGIMFDPEIVMALKNVVAAYPSGMCVETTTGALCIVRDNIPGFSSRPRLKLLNGISKTPLMIDLAADGLFKGVAVSHVVGM
jgi:HD-GYP domain-containing protein (c-di-GMP phosphodiesterase class II)